MIEVPKDLAKFHFKCRYAGNPLLIEGAFNEVENRFLKKEFLSLEYFKEVYYLAYIGKIKSSDGSGAAIFFDYDIKSHEARSWMKKKIQQILNHEIINIVEVYHEYIPFIHYFNEFGYKLRRIQTLSSAKVMIKEFKKNNPLPISPPSNTKVRKLEMRDVCDVVEILRHEFTRNPHHGPNNKSFLVEMKTMIEKEIEKDHCQYVFVNSLERVIGHFGAFLTEDPLWGRLSGFHFMLHESIQRTGLLSFMFSILLTELEDRDVLVVVGSTTHKAIIKNFGKLKRKPFIYTFSNNEDLLGLKEFSKYLDL